MKYQSLLPMAALGLIVSAFVAQAAPKPAPPIQIYGPETIAITAPGNYILMNEVSTEPIGINILANNVTLNLNGHSSYGNYGIVIWGNNDYVYNGTAVGPYNGVIILGSNALLQNLQILAVEIPLYIEFGGSNLVRGCTLQAADAGETAVTLYLTNHNIIANNELVGSYQQVFSEIDQQEPSGIPVTSDNVLDQEATTITAVTGENTFSGNLFTKQPLPQLNAKAIAQLRQAPKLKN